MRNHSFFSWAEENVTLFLSDKFQTSEDGTDLRLCAWSQRLNYVWVFGSSLSDNDVMRSNLNQGLEKVAVKGKKANILKNLTLSGTDPYLVVQGKDAIINDLCDKHQEKFLKNIPVLKYISERKDTSAKIKTASGQTSLIWGLRVFQTDEPANLLEGSIFRGPKLKDLFVVLASEDNAVYATGLKKSSLSSRTDLESNQTVPEEGLLLTCIESHDIQKSISCHRMEISKRLWSFRKHYDSEHAEAIEDYLADLVVVSGGQQASSGSSYELVILRNPGSEESFDNWFINGLDRLNFENIDQIFKIKLSSGEGLKWRSHDRQSSAVAHV